METLLGSSFITQDSFTLLEGKFLNYPPSLKKGKKNLNFMEPLYRYNPSQRDKLVLAEELPP